MPAPSTVTGAAPDPVAEDLYARLPASPDAYPQKVDLSALTVLLIRFSARAYRAASFLDDRILGTATQGAWFPFARVAEAARRVLNPRPLHFIFHTGHVGSTLLSRLLDETGAVLSLREPLPLRTLAEASDALSRPDSLLSEAQFDDLLTSFVRLWARGYAATGAVVIKATSSAGRLAARLMQQAPQARAIYVNLRPEPYLATLLAGANSPIDLRGHAPERIRRLASRTSVNLSPLHELSLGELAALSWLVESWAQRDAVERFPDRVLRVDFEAFLRDVEASGRRIGAHFALPVDDSHFPRIAASAAMTRYSKAPEYEYSPSLRARILDESRRTHADEIRKGMAWLERICHADSAVAKILSG
jgi:hypothetical protein